MTTSNTHQLNVLIYNSDCPIFPGSGAHEFLNTTELAKRVSELGLISMIHNEQDQEDAKVLTAHPINLYLWKSPILTKNKCQRVTRIYKSLLRSVYSFASAKCAYVIKWFARKPFDVFNSEKLFRHMSNPLATALAEKYWHAVIIIQSQSAKVVDYIPNSIAKILVMHDIRSLVYARQKNASKNIFAKFYYFLQAKRYFRYEQYYCSRFDTIIALSQHDQRWIEQHYQPKHTAIIPIPIDVQYFQPLPDYLEIPNRIVFTGHMSHPPNVDAAIYFAKKIFPSIRKVIPTAEFYIVGKNPSLSVLKLGKYPGIYVTGTVPDTRSYLASAAVVVIPLRFASGMRNKILEAWSMQKCVISTSLGAEGLHYTDGVHLKIADDADSMTQEILYVLRHPEFRKNLSHYGRSIAAKDHYPATIGQNYFHTVKNTVHEKFKNHNAMRIAIDLRWMVPGLAGGIEQAARAFIEELGKIDKLNQYVLFLNPKCIRDFDFNQSQNITFMSPKKWDALNKKMRLFLGKVYSKLRIEHIHTSTILNLQFAEELEVDMVYSFPGYIYSDLYSLPHILTVHDIQHEYFPEFFSEYHLTERKRVFGDSIRIAKHITAVSEYTRQTLIDKLNVSPEKITTILQAADPYFTAKVEPYDEVALQKYALKPQSYLYFPAHTWHHKNHHAALKALEILRKKYQLNPMLICTGGKREAKPYLDRTIQELNLKNQVRFLGYLPRIDIPALYRGAIALLYPSLFEGFGIPVLEAMNSGCPVICSNKTSLPEIAGSAALLTDPYDYEAIADQIYQVMTQNELRQALKKLGLQQASKFSWERHARGTVAVFNTVYNKLRSF